MARRGRRAASEGEAIGGAKRLRRRTEAAKAGAEAEGFYAGLFTPDELADLARAEAETSLEDEIALLRVVIRRGVANGESLETISRSVQRLGQTLKVERSLKGESARNLEEALAKVLDEIGNEIRAG